MRPLIVLAFTLPLAAQQPAPAVADTAPRPSGESWVTGNLDIGYRWLGGPGGSLETYRSVVNLGQGVKLVGLDLTFLDPKRRWFDDAHLRAYDWGHDPYATFHMDARKSGLYRLNVDYRGISYFNNLPSYADPLLAKGITLDEQSFDTHRRITSVSLELLPGRAFSPYVAVERDARDGSGVSVFRSDGNEYPVADTTRDSTSLVRGGVRGFLKKVNLNIEFGGTIFKNDQNTFTQGANAGNSQVPVFGQTLNLTSLLQSYGIRGSGRYAKIAVSARPLSWIDVFGQAMYTVPTDTVNYQQYDTGNLILLNQILFYSSEQYMVNAFSRFPHTSASAGWEIRPRPRIRILQSWLLDQMSNHGSATQNDTLLAAGTTVSQTAAVLASTLGTRSSQIDTNLLFDAGRGLTLRGGYRYFWGSANDAVTPDEGLITISRLTMRRHVGMGSASWRPSQKLSLTADIEAGTSGGGYFRTSLYDYQRVRAMARYQLLKQFQVSGDFRIVTNQNPLAGTSYHFRAEQESVTARWTPASLPGIKSVTGVSVDGTYEHCSYQSTVSYLAPQILVSYNSIYREDCHRISGMLNANLRGFHKRPVALEAGGAAVLTSGSRPTTYYQPAAKLTAPLTTNVALFGEWRYYGFGELFYQYESFRAHLVTVGLRFTR